ncbi:MAG: hypothetical protein RLZZ422_1530, partial [Pseudomonadota bacterium]
ELKLILNDELNPTIPFDDEALLILIKEGQIPVYHFDKPNNPSLISSLPDTQKPDDPIEFVNTRVPFMYKNNWFDALKSSNVFKKEDIERLIQSYTLKLRVPTYQWDDKPMFGLTKRPPPNKPFSPKERNSMLSVILGMAIDKYGYDPEANKNPATGSNKNSIKASLERIGISISDDTLKKYLEEAFVIQKLKK